MLVNCYVVYNTQDKIYILGVAHFRKLHVGMCWHCYPLTKTFLISQVAHGNWNVLKFNMYCFNLTFHRNK